MIEDVELFHAGVYDPQKAHEYYLRKRKLKGRPRAMPKTSTPKVARTAATVAVRAGGKPNRADTKSRHEQLLAQQAHLKARLEHLRTVLQDLVDAAQKRAGGDPNKHDQKGKAPETPKDKAARNADQKKQKPLTAKQKTDKAQAAKKAYEKEHPNSLSQDVDILREQVKDIHTKIEKALQDARARRNKAGQNDSKSGSKNQNRSGPQGR